MAADYGGSHPNLPQMIGYSDDETPTPFILLANGMSGYYSIFATTAYHRVQCS